MEMPANVNPRVVQLRLALERRQLPCGRGRFRRFAARADNSRRQTCARDFSPTATHVRDT
jgi:hypothetical protein